MARKISRISLEIKEFERLIEVENKKIRNSMAVHMHHVHTHAIAEMYKALAGLRIEKVYAMSDTELSRKAIDDS